MNTLQWIENKYGTKRKLAFKAGDQVRVHVKIKEGEKERVQVFEGIVIKIHRGGLRTSFTVRKVSYGVGVERVFPLHSPVVDRVELVQSSRVRRSKLYYLRRLSGRKARIDSLEKELGGSSENQEEAGLPAESVSAAG